LGGRGKCLEGGNRTRKRPVKKGVVGGVTEGWE